MDRVVGIIADLMFGSQIKETAIAAGKQYESLRTRADVERCLADDTATVWVINLAAQITADPELISWVVPLLVERSATVLCYAPHVAEDKLEWAASVGAQKVVPRGAAVVTLQRML